MKRYFQLSKGVLILLLLFIGNTLFAQTAGDEDREMFNRAKQRDQQAIDEAKNGWWAASMITHQLRVRWWQDARFGMFIHWGIYSLPGGEWKGKKVGGYAEHLMRKEKITRQTYLELAHQFNPAGFNAEEWILYAKKAGMKYFIITAKHHDGFALFDSKVSAFDIAEQTLFRRDPMAELAAAAKKHGIRFGFYYSHAFDWEHPDAPGNDWEYSNPGGDSNLYGGRNWYDLHPELLPKAVNYVNEKAIPQIKELLIKYHPDIIWFDTPHKLPLSENIRILKAIRETDPNVVVNGRLARNSATNFGDYLNTADRPAEFFPVSGNWEAIPTTNESYGYHRYDISHKPVGHFIQLLANAASRGGNLLMNIGPKGDGTFDERDLVILNGIGQWMSKNGESIYATTISPLPLQNWGVSTQKKDKLYLHVFNWPADGRLYVGGLKSDFRNIYLLADQKKKLAVTRLSEKDILVDLPASAPDAANTVVVVELKDKPLFDTVRFIAPNVTITRLLAFDARLQGKGFNFGDGKTNRYYVEGWKSVDQSLSWKMRLAKPAIFNVVVKYLAGENSGGHYQLLTDGVDRSGAKKVITAKGSEVVSETVATITLSGHEHELTLKAVKIDKAELFKLLEVQLIAADKN